MVLVQKQNLKQGVIPWSHLLAKYHSCGDLNGLLQNLDPQVRKNAGKYL